MLSNGQRAVLDAVKIGVNRQYSYVRSGGDGTDDADLTLRLEDGTIAIHGEVQTVDELEYAVARLIATARKEVSHGKVQPDRKLAWTK